MKVPLKVIEIQFFIVTCCFVGSALSASLFGVDLTPPSTVVKTGVGAISQVFQPQKPQLPTFPFGGNQFSNDSNTSKPTTVGLYEKIKPQKPSSINKLTPEYNQFSTRKPSKDSEKLPGPVESSQITDSIQGADGSILGSSENGTDYTTESVDYEDDYFVGGTPTAVLASLLGGG